MNGITIAKIGTLAIWVWGIASFASPESVAFAEYGRVTAGFLFVAHAVEIVLFNKKIVDQVGGSALGHAIQQLIFGIVHVKATGAKIGKIGA